MCDEDRMDIFAFPYKELEKRYTMMAKKAPDSYQEMVSTLQRECDAFPRPSKTWLTVLRRTPQDEEYAIEIRVHVAYLTSDDSLASKEAMKNTGRPANMLAHKRLLIGNLKSIFRDALTIIIYVKVIAEILTVLETTK